MNLEKLYDATLRYQPASDLITGYTAALGNALAEARVQAENNNPQGMAVAVGTASDIFNHLAAVIRVNNGK